MLMRCLCMLLSIVYFSQFQPPRTSCCPSFSSKLENNAHIDSPMASNTDNANKLALCNKNQQLDAFGLKSFGMLLYLCSFHLGALAYNSIAVCIMIIVFSP